MQFSESLVNIGKALILFHIKVDSVKKDAKNPFFKSNYASLSNILDSINEPLIESGLCFSQFPTGENELHTILIHAESGEYIRSSYVMKPVKDDPQGRGSVITYQRRYALAAILGLNIEEDDDANHATYGGSTPDKAADNNKPWLNKDSVNFNAVVGRLKSGNTTMAKVREHFKVSKEVETLLTEASKN